MNAGSFSLANVFEGWQGYQQSLVRAIAPLNPNQLAWKQSDRVRTLGQLACHIAFARIDWFKFMNAPGIDEAKSLISRWETDDDGNEWIAEETKPIADDADALAQWLNASWQIIETTLNTWTVSDLMITYRHRWNHQTYLNSRQWTIWRVMAHDIHHGGQIARILAEQNIEAFELRGLGGHLVLPPLADATES